MNIYHVTRTDDGGGYDTYSDFVVIAESLEAARWIHPGEYYQGHQEGKWTGEADWMDAWVPVHTVAVELIGTASDNETRRIVCSSFHAG